MLLPKHLPTPDTCIETDPAWQRMLPSALGIGRRRVRLPAHWLYCSTISQAKRTHHLKSCWEPPPEPSSCSVLLITKEKTAAKRSTSDILYLHRSFRFSGFWWGDTGSFKGCRVKSAFSRRTSRIGPVQQNYQRPATAIKSANHDGKPHDSAPYLTNLPDKSP